MNLRNKKALAARTLKVGKDRIVFSQSRLEEIKEAIKKQDIRDLKEEKAITIKDIVGKKKAKKKSRKVGPGKIRKKVNKRKRGYVIMTRKLRKYLAFVKRQGDLSKEEISTLRNKIRNRDFKSKAHLKDHLGGLKK